MLHTHWKCLDRIEKVWFKIHVLFFVFKNFMKTWKKNCSAVCSQICSLYLSADKRPSYAFGWMCLSAADTTVNLKASIKSQQVSETLNILFISRKSSGHFLFLSTRWSFGQVPDQGPSSLFTQLAQKILNYVQSVVFDTNLVEFGYTVLPGDFFHDF